MESIKDRLSQILRSKNLTASQFAELMGIQPSNVSHLLNGRNNPSLDFLIKLKQVFPEYSFDWIILGRKPMTQVESTAENPKQVKVVEKGGITDNILEFPLDDNEGKHTPFIDNREEIVDKQEDNPIMPDLPTRESVIDKLIVIYDDKTFEVIKPR